MRYFILSVAMIFSTGCISKALEKVIPQKDYKAEKVQKIRSIAIVAYDVMQFQPTGLGSKITGHLSTAQTAQNRDPEENELALTTYGDLVERFAKKGIRVVSYEQVTKNQDYKTIFESRTHNIQEKMSANSFQKPYVIKGMLRPTNPDYLLTADQIKHLGLDLKVDAVVYARLSYSTRQNDYLGLGLASIYLTSNLQFQMHETATGQKIWFDYGFEGAISDESIGKVSGLENKDTITKLNRPLAAKTFDDFLKR